ncbi:Variant-specific surface protein, partial [Giardia duodenalis]
CTSCTYTSSTLKCTACGEGKKPNKEGTECFDCGISGCTYCSGTGKCEECGSGFSLEGEACISTGGVNLSTGAIAGISVAAVVVVGGLVGFLCWWFICRGKA